MGGVAVRLHTRLAALIKTNGSIREGEPGRGGGRGVNQLEESGNVALTGEG